MEVGGHKIILLRSAMPRMTLLILEIDDVPHSLSETDITHVTIGPLYNCYTDHL